jgi:hypothetical protein
MAKIERNKSLSFDKNALILTGIKSNTDKLQSRCKQRAQLKDVESDYNACFANPPIYKNGNSMHLLNSFFNANIKEKKPMRDLPANQDEIVQIIYAKEK